MAGYDVSVGRDLLPELLSDSDGRTMNIHVFHSMDPLLRLSRYGR